MLFLAKKNSPGEAVEALRQEGHDVAWVRTDAPGAADQEVLKRAQKEVRGLLTFDKDFGELAFRIVKAFGFLQRVRLVFNIAFARGL